MLNESRESFETFKSGSNGGHIMNLFYEQLNQKLISLIDGVPYRISNLANASALLWQELPDINWAGFYLLEDEQLILGPFQGKPACTVIAFGKGVCGRAASTRKTQLVPDVHAFPGHIACDASSRSEIVIPLLNNNGELFGVLDIDSPYLNRFTDEDREGLEQIAACLR